ncbi:LEM domain-containing protein Man1 [Schizosaccharomyces japonicus yFS275]|uniref:LEM domain-containing protein Man1 n=1 Tax=Schizosaccharomyces japonicus (strain yFS275 / FY16936) TaxID=402676 RepID=B6K496_SCHJY|nr:LEM domain-containing protein Man1 [Schizosaccharomyces japonicus yFS275]EEB08303.1 LEM domain-containing protein Man1 [Schizosaccharomyces japonicus yFS275]
MDESTYFDPEFDASSLRVVDLRRILGQHNLYHPSTAKKAQLIELFNKLREAKNGLRSLDVLKSENAPPPRSPRKKHAESPRKSPRKQTRAEPLRRSTRLSPKKGKSSAEKFSNFGDDEYTGFADVKPRKLFSAEKTEALDFEFTSIPELAVPKKEEKDQSLLSMTGIAKETLLEMPEFRHLSDIKEEVLEENGISVKEEKDKKNSQLLSSPLLEAPVFITPQRSAPFSSINEGIRNRQDDYSNLTPSVEGPVMVTPQRSIPFSAVNGGARIDDDSFSNLTPSNEGLVMITPQRSVPFSAVNGGVHNSEDSFSNLTPSVEGPVMITPQRSAPFSSISAGLTMDAEASITPSAEGPVMVTPQRGVPFSSLGLLREARKGLGSSPSSSPSTEAPVIITPQRSVPFSSLSVQRMPIKEKYPLDTPEAEAPVIITPQRSAPFSSISGLQGSQSLSPSVSSIDSSVCITPHRSVPFSYVNAARSARSPLSLSSPSVEAPVMITPQRSVPFSSLSAVAALNNKSTPGSVSSPPSDEAPVIITPHRSIPFSSTTPATLGTKQFATQSAKKSPSALKQFTPDTSILTQSSVVAQALESGNFSPVANTYSSPINPSVFKTPSQDLSRLKAFDYSSSPAPSSPLSSNPINTSISSAVVVEDDVMAVTDEQSSSSNQEIPSTITLPSSPLPATVLSSSSELQLPSSSGDSSTRETAPEGSAAITRQSEVSLSSSSDTAAFVAQLQSLYDKAPVSSQPSSPGEYKLDLSYQLESNTPSKSSRVSTPSSLNSNKSVAQTLPLESPLVSAHSRLAASRVVQKIPPAFETRSRSKSSWKYSILAFAMFVFSVFVYYWRQSVLHAGFCEVSTLDSEDSPLLAPFPISCTPCPEHAECYAGYKFLCENGYKKKTSFLNQFGLGKTPSCVVDEDWQIKTSLLARYSLQELSNKNQQTGYRTDSEQRSGYTGTKSVSLKALYDNLWSRQVLSVPESEFSQLFAGTLNLLKNSEDIETTDSTIRLKKSAPAVSLPPIPNGVPLTFIQRHRAILAVASTLVLTVVASAAFLLLLRRYQASRLREESVRACASYCVSRLQTIKMNALRTGGPAYVEVSQLRDECLQQKHSSYDASLLEAIQQLPADVQAEVWREVMVAVENMLSVHVHDSDGVSPARSWEWIGVLTSTGSDDN